jgi:cystathionine beta-lyase
MMILCSPHNPVGRVWKKEELLKAGRICLENNVTLVSDEIHADLVRKTGLDYTPVHIPADSLFSETSDRIITCTAPSKTFNLAGFNHANIIIRNKELREKWEYEFMEVSNFPGVNPISLAAAQAAYSDGEEWLDKLLKYIDTNMLMIKKFVDKNLSGAEFNIPEGTYLAWLDLRKYNLDDNELEELLLKKAKVYLNQGYIFGTEGSGFVRINAACPASLLKDSLERIADALHHV